MEWKRRPLPQQSNIVRRLKEFILSHSMCSKTIQSSNHTNIICYIAKINFRRSKNEKKMGLILNFNNTTSRDTNLFVATCLAFYY